MVLQHVAGGAGGVVEAGPGADADVLGHGDLHRVDVVGVPHRLEQRGWRSAGRGCSGPSPCPGSGRSGTRPAAVNTSSTRSLSSLRRVEVVAERLLHHDPAPAAGLVVVGHPGALQLLEHDRERGRRDGQVERRVALDAVACRAARRGSRRAWSKAASSSNEPGTNLMLPASRAQTSSRHGVRACLRAASRASVLEVAVAPVAAGEAEHHEAGRQQAPVGQVVDGRQQLLAGQVAGDAEDDERARLRDPGQPPVLRVAQRVRPALLAEASRSSSRSCAVQQLCRDRRHGRSGAGAAAGGPRSASACRSPAACAACSWPKVYGRPGTARSSATAPVICRNAPTWRPTLVVLPGGVQEPRPPAEGDRPAGAPGQRRRAGPAAVGVAEPVQVGHDRQVAPSGDGRVEQRGAAPPASVVGGAEQRRVAVHLDRAVGERRPLAPAGPESRIRLVFSLRLGARSAGRTG